MISPPRKVRCSGIFVTALVMTATVGGGGTSVAAQDEVTFTRDVAPILYGKCVSCHRPGELAPMALRTFDEVRPWARGIRDKVLSGEMPPWFAESRLGYFKNDPRLTEDEVATLTR